MIRYIQNVNLFEVGSTGLIYLRTRGFIFTMEQPGAPPLDELGILIVVNSRVGQTDELTTNTVGAQLTKGIRVFQRQIIESISFPRQVPYAAAGSLYSIDDPDETIEFLR